jgi:hypothetical protein
MPPDNIEFSVGVYLVIISFDEDEAHGGWSAFITVMRGAARVAASSWSWYAASGSFSSYDGYIPADHEDDVRTYIMARKDEIEAAERQ